VIEPRNGLLVGVVDAFKIAEDKRMKIASDRLHPALGVLEHGMYLKRMYERGRPHWIFKEEVPVDKSKQQGNRDV